jgi:hypothetical protein
MQLRDYQIKIANEAVMKLINFKIVYLAAQVRTGKTLMALETASLYKANRVLFITKKKAISSIQSDYEAMGYNYDLTVVNYESLHLIKLKFDLVIIDEAHRLGAYPKPCLAAKLIKQQYAKLPMIFLSGTPTPESYSQIYHQLWVSEYTPFKEYTNFYKWAHKFVNITQQQYSQGLVNNYDKARQEEIIKITDKYFISFTQKQAGFTSTIEENIIECEMAPITYELCERLKKDFVVTGNKETILADTAVKLMGKIHQLCSGTVIFESGNFQVIDTAKADLIKEKFKHEKIAIFYKFKAELAMLKQVFGDNLCENLEEFNTTTKNIALQIVSGREGISLKAAKYLVFLTIDFSAVSFWQARDRMTTKERPNNTIFWVFAKGGIEHKIYERVLNKQDFTLSHFKDYVRKQDTVKDYQAV